MGRSSKTKNEKKRARKRALKEEAKKATSEEPVTAAAAPTASTSNGTTPPSDVKVEYVKADVAEAASSVGDENLAEFQRIFGKFVAPEELTSSAPRASAENQDADNQDDAAVEEEEEEVEVMQLSKKKRKKLSRLSVAELKQLVDRPDVVQAEDVTSSDPKLLVYLKAYRNSVPVPRHWSAKRKYLQGKRGVEKAGGGYKLPDYIEATGIAKLTEAAGEQDEKKKLKQKARDRTAPKMGRVQIDYQVLHDAFFKHQTKPDLTRPGDLYYEGKEFEIRETNHQPGQLSLRLREALGITEETSPPPWLVHMQRYGPPPSYPNLKIPGLNAPIPAGAVYGYHIGGWGKPPVDETGAPLYGDVFGTDGEGGKDEHTEVDKTLWGELESESEAESSEEEDDDDDDEDDDDADDAMDDGTETPLVGAASMASGLGTPDTIDLRKGLRRDGVETPITPVPDEPRQLYTVLEQQAAHVGAGQIVGTTHTYVVPGAGAAAADGTASVAAIVADGTTSVAAAAKEKKKKEKKAAKAKNIF